MNSFFRKLRWFMQRRNKEAELRARNFSSTWRRKRNSVREAG